VCRRVKLARFPPIDLLVDPRIARVPSTGPALFEDGFGERRLALGVNGDQFEVLTLRDELTQSAVVENALRDRVSRLADFQSEHFGHVRGVERAGKSVPRVMLVSDHVPGVRLSRILETAESHLLPFEMHAALCLLRQLVHAVAIFHDKAPDVCHGAIGPERILVTPNARLVLVEYVLGSAIEQLRYSNKQYWQDLRVPLPRTFGMPHLDRRTDVTQVGATALALIIGRPLAEEEFPAQISDMSASALSLSPGGALEPLPLPLKVWLQRALQIDSKTPFGSAPEAWAELDRVLHYSDPIAEIESLKLFMSRHYAAVGSAEPSHAVTAQASPAVATSSRVALSSTSSQAAPAYTPMPTSNRPSPSSASPAPAPQASTAPAAPGSQAAAPQQPSRPAVGAGTSGFWEKSTKGSVETPPVSAPSTPPAVEQVRQSVSAKSPLSKFKLAAAALLLITLTSAITLGALRYMAAPVAADGMGTLDVQTNPTGAAVDVDGQPRGTTPLSVSLSPGRHTLKLANEGNVRSMPITIVAGGQVSQLIELPRAASLLGELQVRTDPAGAQVTVDGHAYGKSPLTVEGLSPGVHSVLLENELGSMTQDVKVEAGTTASLVVPLSSPKNAPVSGWISVNAPVPLQIFEDSRLLGSSQSERIMVSVGRHQLVMVNEGVGFSQSQVVNVTPGRVTPIKPRWPSATTSFNATPWAEVWVDGQQIGETPLANIAVPVGNHDVLFRHPELGEKHVRAVVTLTTPAKVSVDMRQR
jgi:serine/threonine protein kinase